MSKSKFMTDHVIEVYGMYKDASPHRTYAMAFAMMCFEYHHGASIGGVSWREVWADDPKLSKYPVPCQQPFGFQLPKGWSVKAFTKAYKERYGLTNRD